MKGLASLTTGKMDLALKIEVGRKGYMIISKVVGELLALRMVISLSSK